MSSPVNTDGGLTFLLTQPGADHCSPYSLMCGLRATACRAIANSYPASHRTCRPVGSMLGSEPSLEFAPPPISSFSSCSEAPNPGLNR
jgi:hypothetical protein